LRKQWQEPIEEIERMQTWIIETEHILAGDWAEEEEVLTNQTVASRFDAHLANLQAKLSTEEKLLSEREKVCLTHFLEVSASLRPRLINCYDLPELPRTNNDMERYIRALKTRYRRVSGRKNWNAYLLRYGENIAYFDCFEQAGVDDRALFTLFCRVDHQTWRETRQHHRSVQNRRLKLFRFRHQQKSYLRDLEDRWEQTLKRT
jgi:hypothetical protein